ncbi:MAG: HPr family phosphocarrier protein [Clostridium sp.]
MVKAKVKIKNPTGLHLRPAGIFCTEAGRYQSSITFSYKNSISNAKSVLSVLGACIKCGDEIELMCEGVDEEAALTAMLKAVDDGLGE